MCAKSYRTQPETEKKLENEQLTWRLTPFKHFNRYNSFVYFGFQEQCTGPAMNYSSINVGVDMLIAQAFFLLDHGYDTIQH